MWFRANNLPQPRNGHADLANDIDLTGIDPFLTKAIREQSYPQASCFGGAIKPRYCPNSEQLGDPCRFDGECVSPLICGGFQPLCGLPDGPACATARTSAARRDSTASSRALSAADNVCREKKDSGEPCLHKGVQVGSLQVHAQPLWPALHVKRPRQNGARGR